MEIQISFDKSTAKFRPKRHKRREGGDHSRGEEQSAPYLAWQGAGAGGRGAELTKRREREGIGQPLRAATFVSARVSTPLIFCGISGEGSLARSILFWLNRGAAGTVSRRRAACCLTRFYHASRGRREGGEGGRKRPKCDLSFIFSAVGGIERAIREMRVKSQGQLRVRSPTDRTARNRFGRTDGALKSRGE